MVICLKNVQTVKKIFKYPVYKTGITTLELPDKIAFYIEFDNCKKSCKGCHSPWLAHRNTEKTLAELAQLANEARAKGANAILLLGGTTNGISLDDLQLLIMTLAWRAFPLPIGLYTPDDKMNRHLIDYLTYYKLGAYIEKYGGMAEPTTNQHLFVKDSDGRWHDITYKFRR